MTTAWENPGPVSAHAGLLQLLAQIMAELKHDAEQGDHVAKALIDFDTEALDRVYVLVQEHRNRGNRACP